MTASFLVSWPAGTLPIDARHAKAGIVGKILRHFRGSRRFQPEIHFDAGRLGKGLDDGDRTKAPGRNEEAFEKLGDEGKGVELAAKISPHIRPDHLDGGKALAAVVIADAGLVDLGDRGSADHFAELDEEFVDLASERDLDFGNGELGRKGRHLVLKEAELGGDIRADDVGARRQKLAELDIRGPEPVQRARQIVRPLAPRGRAPLQKTGEAIGEHRPGRQAFGRKGADDPLAGQDEGRANKGERTGNGIGHGLSAPHRQ